MLTRRQALGTGLAAALAPSAFPQQLSVSFGSLPSLVLPNDLESIDYGQFPAGVLDTISPTASVTARVFRKALAWSSIDPTRLGPVILFGVRGAELLDGERFESGATDETFRIRDTRPDHVNLRCTLGVWNTLTDTFFVARGSTVAHVRYLERQCLAARSAEGPRNVANQMPTGVYYYGIGTHQNIEPGRQPGAFKLDDTITLVRNLSGRSLSPTRFDKWDIGGPETGNNIHAGEGRPGIPGIEAAEELQFLSAGCQIVEGDYVNGRSKPTGAWRRFRVAAGLKADPVILRRHPVFRTTCLETDEDSWRVCHAGERLPGSGKTYPYILLTGAELRLAAENLDLPNDHLRFARIRKGSSGPRVAALLEALGQPRAETFEAVAQNVLIQRFQIPAGNGADGQLTPEEARRIGLGIVW